ncbi:Lon protease family protein [Tautonia marina]|uniref:Lon protease family protein n=1 Tax=Tautonia marina TaxID=2653855 RepID=UPI001260B530|nr:AAA family ATPase [Tautonia marina]
MTSTPAGDRFELTPADLAPQLSPDRLGFQTTAELDPLDDVVGQDRALKALELGLSIRHRGYNVFASGLSGTDTKELIRRLLEVRARLEPTPDDWAYVHNFDEPDRPLALRLPGGHGVRLRDALEQLLDRLRHDLPEALKAKDFSAERDRLGASFGQRSEALFDDLLDQAKRLNLNVQRLPNGVLNIIPLKDGRPMEARDFEQLGESERADVERRQKEMGEHVAATMARQQELMAELHEAIEEIVRGFARRILDPLFDRVKADFPAAPLATWLDRLRDHLLDHLDRLKQEDEPPPGDLNAQIRRADPWLACRVNVVADHSHAEGAPLVVELAPSYKNLFGTVEHDVNLFGRVTTDFTRIKPGSLLRASGGYLVLDLEDALTEPLVWKQLKRALRSGQLLTEAYDPLSLFSAAALRPQPIPIDTKVVALGPVQLYYLLREVDEEFAALFKIRADFGDETPRDEQGEHAYARFVARVARKEGLPPFTAAAVAEVICFGARAAGHREKLSVEFGEVADLVREAGYWARADGKTSVSGEHVRRALDERVYRGDRIAAKIRELIREGTLRIALRGQRVGQINGLPLLQMGELRFGWPSRITAAAGIGQEGVVSIEREVELSGDIHNKGVLILGGYLLHRYARQHPLALSASLTFEQSYGWIEGDSASSAELYCLLSALADVPLRQDIAVTGSVNQHGEVQVVGGINEKIEGFFDACRLTGLTGTQGVCIPRGNVSNLVLRPDVIRAVSEGRFHVWAVDTIDEGIELLTGLPAGDLDQEETFHYRLDRRQQEILSLLESQPTPAVVPHVRQAVVGGTPAPAPPPLPGERG